MTLYRVQLRDAAVAALQAANTLAGSNILVNHSLPTALDKLPAIAVTAPRDRATSNNRGATDYTRVTTLAIRGQLCGETPEIVGTYLDELAEQIELAIMQDLNLQGMITQVVTIDTDQIITSQTREHTGEIRFLFGLEYIEEYPPAGTPLTTLTGQMQANGNADFAGMQVLPTLN
ncbi:hypothetical protein B0W47_11355 [Komagataeibacter nataicola]|uniref:Uncharacterized protein n=1 Tax=Komagataeibacter nataicola TaxID=265960 RepID=A0A9N7CEH0_9PROT|nr:hypothetical protein [Komagataeibacter nataicola]AQU87969.1 hypothetical protein B0W47_11355 [Komagataeibacter nataicola]PYD66497.1 hypothetical protein CDI09_08405 [Komagataeibacter nataicola]WNM09439.1 hypothetical protein RI056_05650 [Komagataeibacter nataicola]GBR26740.1 hypothetical protein AA0616_3293 [Komagataeibacter nataicola NRIC 0616]